MKIRFHSLKLWLIASLVFALSACDSDPCSFNIDKHEILTGIDIPKVSNSACVPQTEMGFKLSVWEIDTLALNENDYYGSLDNYIDHFEFVKLNGEVNKEKIALIPDVYQASLLGKNLYYKEGERNDKKWILIINQETGVLFGEVIDLSPAEDD